MTSNDRMCRLRLRGHHRAFEVVVVIVVLIVLLSSTLTFASSSDASSSTNSSAKRLKSGWNNLTDAYLTAPPARVFAASSGGAPVPPPYPTWSRGLVIFGGTGSSSKFSPLFNDVWVLNPLDKEGDGRAWTQIPIIPSLPSPQPRCLSAAAVDSHGMLYIFGGFDGHDWYNDFWRLNLTVIQTPGENIGWEELPVHDQWPSPVCGHSMMWSGDMQSLLLFGGGYDYKTVYNDIWQGTEYGWKKLQTLGSPPSPREFHSAAFNEGDTILYVFGGYAYGYTYFNDTWQFYNGTEEQLTWVRLGVDGTAPPARANTVMVRWAVDGLLIFGGRADDGRVVFNDVWQFDTYDWSLMDDGSEPESPTARFGMSSILYDSDMVGLLIFGGEDSSGQFLLADIITI